MRSRQALAAALSLALTGCASPMVKPNPPIAQWKTDHVSDWQALARRGVNRLEGTTKTQDAGGLKIFVAPGPADMPFAVAYKRFIEEELLDRNYTVLQSSSGASQVINFDVQTYLYARDKKKHLIEYATFWTTLETIGYQFRHVSKVGTGVGWSAVAGPVVDALAALDGGSNAEVVVTLTAADLNRVYRLDSEIIYVRPSDLTFYFSEIPSSVPQVIPAEPLTEVVLPVRSQYR